MTTQVLVSSVGRRYTIIHEYERILFIFEFLTFFLYKNKVILHKYKHVYNCLYVAPHDKKHDKSNIYYCIDELKGI